jgi:hypothetical protein
LCYLAQRCYAYREPMESDMNGYTGTPHRQLPHGRRVRRAGRLEPDRHRRRPGRGVRGPVRRPVRSRCSPGRECPPPAPGSPAAIG